jgi:hypothetical protein
MTRRSTERAANSEQMNPPQGGKGPGHVKNQHVVSKVLLKQWAVPGPKSKGWHLARFNPRFPHRSSKRASLQACAYVKDYVPVDSAATEALWQETENKANRVLAALDQGAPFEDLSNIDIFS